MKKIYSLLIIAFLGVALISCKKETEGISKVTHFADFDMKGERYLSIVKGSTYTEAGVSAKEGETDLTIVTSGSVDVNTVGVYDITYSAINKDGYPGSITRTVAVLPAAEQAGVNIAGQYKNAGSFNFTADMKKLAPGFYVVNNMWGNGSGAVIAAYLFCLDGTNIILPVSGLSGYGRVSGTAVLSGTSLVYTANLLDQGLSNSVRTWIKL